MFVEKVRNGFFVCELVYYQFLSIFITRLFDSVFRYLLFLDAGWFLNFLCVFLGWIPLLDLIPVFMQNIKWNQLIFFFKVVNSSDTKRYALLLYWIWFCFSHSFFFRWKKRSGLGKVVNFHQRFLFSLFFFNLHCFMQCS